MVLTDAIRDEKLNLPRKNFYQKCKEMGKCPNCGKDKGKDGFTLCQSCREKMNSKDQARREKRKEAGLCISCGKPVQDKRHTRCAKCRKKYNDRNKEYYRLHREKQLSLNMDRKRRLKQLGLCVDCKKPLQDNEQTLCTECHGIQKKKWREYYASHRKDVARRKLAKKQERMQAGLCISCGKAVQDSRYARCTECREKTMREARRATKATSKRWSARLWAEGRSSKRTGFA